MVLDKKEQKIYQVAQRFSSLVAFGAGLAAANYLGTVVPDAPFLVTASTGIVAGGLSFVASYPVGLKIGENHISHTSDNDKEAEITKYLNNDNFVLFKMDRSSDYQYSFYDNAQGVRLFNEDKKLRQNIVCDIDSSSNFRSWHLETKGERYFAVPKGSIVKVYCNDNSENNKNKLITSFTLEDKTVNQFKYVLHAVDKMYYNDLVKQSNIEYSHTNTGLSERSQVMKNTRCKTHNLAHTAEQSL